MMDYSIILKNNQDIIGDSSAQGISLEDFEKATEMVVQQGENAWSYSPSINQTGGFTSLSGGENLTRADAMILLGGQDNYHAMLSLQGLTLPTAVTSGDDQSIMVDGQSLDPNFYIYPDGEIYLAGYNNPLTEEMIRQYWPHLYEALFGSTTQESTTSTTQPATTPKTTPTTTGGGGTGNSGGGSGGRSTGGSKSTSGGSSGSSGGSTGGSTTSTKTGESTTTASPTNQSSTSSTEASAAAQTVRVDYSNLDAMASSLKQSLAKVKGLTGDYASVVQEMSGSTTWVGDERDAITSLSSAEYLNYMNSVCSEAEALLAKIQACSQAFQDAENRILSLSL